MWKANSISEFPLSSGEVVYTDKCFKSMGVYFHCTAELVLNKQLIFQSVKARGISQVVFWGELLLPLWPFSRLLNAARCRGRILQPDQLTYLGLTGLEVSNYCRGCRCQRNGWAMRQRLAEARGSRASQCSPCQPLSLQVYTWYQVCPAEKPSSINLGWISWIYVLLTRTHNKEFILMYGHMTAAEWQIMFNPEHKVYLY